MTEQIEKGHSDDLTHWGQEPSVEADTAKPAIHDMDMIMDLPVKVMIELGGPRCLWATSCRFKTAG